MGIDSVSGSGSSDQSDLTTNQTKTDSSAQATPSTEEDTTSTSKKPSSKEELIVQTFLDSDLAAIHPEEAQAVEENQDSIEKGLGFSLQIKSSTEAADSSSQEETASSIDAYNTTVSEEDTSSGNAVSASKSSKKPKLF